ncbi:stage II sporulation protein P [Xylanibacillus composti]|uniref:Stage II sporulation protein P n=1 Tax=Xylanibacillus composti TaxID=1572762 RepID=A0A8J4H2F8_9BACL|nr:stage II sporulation protein P [Xylanibacillus composti]GIQ69718.1 stage II sporulation protein P [Xylanibacillus composti]
MNRKHKWTLHPFVLLSISTLALFIVLGIGGLAQAKWSHNSPLSSIQGAAASLSGKFFSDMMAMEIPYMSEGNAESSFSSDKIFSFVFQMATNINPHDPKTLLASGVPGMASEKTVNLRSAVGNPGFHEPADYAPPREVLQPADDAAPGDEPTGREAVTEEDMPLDAAEPNPSDGQQEDSGAGSGAPSPASVADEVLAFIYHSHNRESYLPELEGKTELHEAFDDTINVTLLGKRMAERLKELGIGAASSDKDYSTEEPEYNWNFSYKYSQKTVKEAFASFPKLNYLFDIHRDAQPRDLTTATINGEDYAQVYFIIGRRNPQWEKNESFANAIHSKLEEAYPGLSRGVWGKTASSGNAEYNQSLSENSILIEIGGPENTLEECYRTVDVLSKIIAEQILEAERVNNEQSGPGQAI